MIDGAGLITYGFVLIWLLVLLGWSVVLNDIGMRRKLAMRRVFRPQARIIIDERRWMNLLQRSHDFDILDDEPTCQ